MDIIASVVLNFINIYLYTTSQEIYDIIIPL